MPGSWNTVSMKITPVSEITTMSMLSIATTGISAFRSTCFRRTRHSLGTFRPSSAHVVLVHRLEQARPDHARVERGEQERERDPRQNQVVRP